jgi:hypothetical protein
VPNTIPSLTAAGTLPDLAEALASRSVASETWARLGGLLNHLHSRGQTWRVSQTWDRGICALDDATAALPATMAGPWRVPLLSWAHVGLRCRIFAEVGSGGANPAKARFLGTAAAVDIQVNPGPAAWYSGVLALPAAPAAWDDVELQAAVVEPGDDLIVHHVHLAIEPIASPLAAAVATGPTGDYVPHGLTTLGPDYPLSASRLRQALANLDSLYQRRRVLYCWASLSADVQTYVGASTVGTYLSPRGHLLIPRLQQRDDPLTAVCAVHALAREQGTARVVRVSQYPDGPTLELPVAVGAGPAWVTGTLDLRAARSPVLPGATSPHAGLQVYPGVAGDDAPHSTTDVYSVTIWGV